MKFLVSNGKFMENLVFVFFDISNDKIRNKVGEVCKDYGLVRTQYSGFVGKLSKNKIEELYLKLVETIGDEKALLIVQPICEKCSEKTMVLGEFKTENEIKEVEEKNIWDLPYNINITET